MKYRKKPVVVEATQWHKDGDHPAVFMRDSYTKAKVSPGITYVRKVPVIKTLEGEHIVTPGDWIITGVKGEHYPCKPDVFEVTYELVGAMDMAEWNQSTAEACARVMGLHATTNAAGFPAWTTGNGSGCFQINPHTDDGDSRRLEAACMRWLHSNETKVPIQVWERDCELDDARRAGNAQEYRNAVFALAVAIGKVIDGGGV